MHIHDMSKRSQIACVPKEIPMKRNLNVDLFLFNVAFITA